jgi:ankyrin repeat protein
MQSLAGRCFCSEVQFEVSAPDSESPRHKLSTRTAVIWPYQLKFVQGEEDLHTLTWGEGSSWQECRRCRTRLFYRQAPGEEIYVQLGAIRGRFRCRNMKLPDWLHVGPAPSRLVRQFHRAARLGRFSMMRRLLADGVPVDAEVQGQTALELASHSGRLRICRLLLSHGADVRRALRHAWQHLPVDRTRPLFQLLLRHGYPAQDLLPLAIDSGAVGALALVLEQPVNLNQQDDRGQTLLERATNSPVMLRLLLKAGIDVGLVGEQGTHALGWCSYFGHARSAKILLEGMFPPDLAEHGSPGAALRYACRRGHVETVRLLLQFGANPNLAEYGKTPLMLASTHGSLATVEMLLAAGADIKAKDARGRTVTDLARSFLPDLLSVAERRAHGWPGDGPVRRRWRRGVLTAGLEMVQSADAGGETRRGRSVLECGKRAGPGAGQMDTPRL